MKLPSEAERLRIYIGESDMFEGRPLHQVLVEEARRRGLAGATVLRGTLGFGANSCIHSTKNLKLSQDLPMVVEIVDNPERIAGLLPEIDSMLGEGLVTREKVQVILYRHEVKPTAKSVKPPRTTKGAN
jgi:PII-like signaling protein